MQKNKNKDPDIVIRKLRGKNDIEVCANIMASSEPWITLRRGYEESAETLSDPSKEVYVAETNSVVTGFIIIVMKGAFTSYIQTVGVAPDWRNKGIGTKLVNFAEERIFRDSPNVFMCVSSFNKNAMRLYKRMGYEVVGELKNYIVSGFSEILLRKTIAPLSEFSNSK
ncbi:GNAT family N-acetyltransferase [candidate division KSB1 bacterium]